MATSARTITTVGWPDPGPADLIRERLECAARSLPESDLKSVILATLAERAPTVRESLVWIALLQRASGVRRSG